MYQGQLFRTALIYCVIAPTAALHVHAGISQDSVAVCITGLQRNLLAKPMRSMFMQHVSEPLQRAGYRVDVYMSIVNPISTRDTILKSYAPVVLDFLKSADLGAHRLMSIAEGDTDDSQQILTQWQSIRNCYDHIEKMEMKTGKPYSWIYRLRSDAIALADVPLPSGLSLDSVYVPKAGMTGEWKYACINDHAFLCPRALCRPYFTVPELWSSNYTSKDSNLQESVPDGISGPPTEPFRLPRKSSSFGQFWFGARYGTTGCNDDEMPSSCCGLIRPVPWYYVLSRDTRPCSHCELFCASVTDKIHEQSYCQGFGSLSPRCQYMRCDVQCQQSRDRCTALQQEWQSSDECRNQVCEVQ